MQTAERQVSQRRYKVWSGTLLFLVIYICSAVPSDSISGQWRSWSDWADAQADLGLHCLHMPKDTFPHAMTHIISPTLLAIINQWSLYCFSHENSYFIAVWAVADNSAIIWWQLHRCWKQCLIFVGANVFLCNFVDQCNLVDLWI